MALAVAGVMAASPFMLTGCSGEKGDTGPAGEPGATWYSGTQYSAEQGKVGDFFFDTDDFDIYQKTSAGWTLISNIKGETGKSAYEVAKEAGFTGTEEQWLASLEGEAGKSVTNVNVEYEYGDMGQIWAVFTVTYSEGEPQVIKSLVPKRIVSVQGLALSDNSRLEKFAVIASTSNAPKLYVQVSFDDYSTGVFPLTNDMFNVDEYNKIPDFKTVGSYDYSITCFGQTINSQLEIVDLADYSTNTVTSVNLVDYTIPTNTSMSDILVGINYQEVGSTIYAQLSDVAETYYDEYLEEEVDEIDLTQKGYYDITLKSQFAYDLDADSENETLHLYVYDANCTVWNISVNDYDPIELEYGKADFEDDLKAVEFEGYLYEQNAKGEWNFEGTVADLSYDLTNFDINQPGIQYIPFTYQLEGETGVYSDYMEVSVVADLSEATVSGTYTVAEDDMEMMMFVETYGNTVTLYDNGIAVIKDASNVEDNGTQFLYDMDLAEEGVFKIFDSLMNDYTYYSLVDGETDTITVYNMTGEPTAYTCQIEIMDMMFNSKAEVYGTEGTCKTKVSVLMPPEMTGAPEAMYVTYAFVDCEWEDADTLTFAGRTFDVTTGNVLVEVSE